MSQGNGALQQPEIFIAFSGDVGSFVATAREVVDDISNCVFVGRLKSYSWPMDPFKEGWGAERTWQEHIGGPQKANCKGTIAILGERIGLPLPNDDFGQKALQELSPIARQLGLKLKLGRAAGRNEIPLTGTVYEVLSSLRVRRPTNILVLGDQSVINHKLRASQRSFGFNQHRQAIVGDHEAESEYPYQRAKLVRFIDAIHKNRRIQNFFGPG